MNINVGSKSPAKVDAVKETINDYDILRGSEIISLDVSSDVSENPLTLNETIQGAMNRAKNSFNDCKYSFGIENGMMKIENTKTGYMNFCVCVIFDGKDYHLGISSGFEYPKKVTQLILSDRIDASEAYVKAGLTEKKKIGYSEGAIGHLTKGRLILKEYIKQSIVMALTHIENPNLF